MGRRSRALVVGLGLLLALLPGARATGSGPEAAPLAAPLGTGITYQGFLKQNGVPANGTFAMQFQLFDAASGGVQVGPTLSPNVAVTNGQFTVPLDFGAGAFNGEARWLAITVQGTPLTPRQAVRAAPYALALGGLRTEPNATSPNVIGGFSGNSVPAGVVGATIGGGGEITLPHLVTDNYGTVGGGANNRAGDNAGTTSDRAFATVGGGQGNTASGLNATVGGGTGNTASGTYATVPGGADNTASGTNATVGGGFNNTAGGLRATVPGGFNNTASGDFSFAAGRQALALGAGTFVWNDSNTIGAPFASDTNLGTGPGQFNTNTSNSFHVRATGGVRFVTSTGNNVGAFLAAGGSTWTSVSHSSFKEHFAPVDGRAVLAALAALPIATWNLRSEDPSIRHMGPMAEDFYAAFGLGYGEATISTGDADGVAFAAIQGLYGLVQEQAALLAALEAANAVLQEDRAALAEQVRALAARLAAVEQAVAAREAP